MKVICISGKARHGKDTFASMLKDHLENCGQRVLITHFADLLKYICKNFFSWDGQKNEEGRTLLQYVGTDVIRSQNPAYWTKFIISILSMFPNEWEYVIIPDCRFPNEFECFKDNNFETYLVRIERPFFDSGLTEQQLQHPSETALDEYKADCYVVNTSLHFLKSQIPTILATIGD